MILSRNFPILRQFSAISFIGMKIDHYCMRLLAEQPSAKMADYAYTGHIWTTNTTNSCFPQVQK